MSTFQSSYFINSGTIIQEIRGEKRERERKKERIRRRNRAKKCKTMHFLCQK
jgi:hypothetical protein